MDDPITQLSTAHLWVLWEQFDGTNMPDGFDGSDILLELQRRGEDCSV